ncbi:TPA: DNA replication complex GINS family protein [Candidatus Woesearchaeota archaeon]|nr:DNA replication complex GINS family protein [Candidatus Woesearchaeota archaeon]
MVEDKPVVITYETLFEILRREKDREALQQLPEGFYKDVVGYLHEKQEALHKSEEPGAKARLEKELSNIKHIVKDIYERRENKLVRLALDFSRIGSRLADQENILKEEQWVFGLLASTLGGARKDILMQVLAGNVPKELSVRPEQRFGTERKKQLDAARETILIRFLHAVPRFLGKELEEYGPFEEEDVASLPYEIAKVLLAKGRAEEISEY